VYNGFIYAGGGQKNGSPNTYPLTWQKVALGTGVATLLANIPRPVDEMGSIWVGDKHYVVQGYNQNGSSGTYSDMMVYNDATNTWSTVAGPGNPAQGLSHNGTDGTNLYCVLGNSANMYRYNVSAGNWTTLAAKDDSNVSGGRRMPYRASNTSFYQLDYRTATSNVSLKIFNTSTNTWTYNSAQPARFYDTPWNGSDNYQCGFDIDHTGNNLYLYSYDQGGVKTSPARAAGGTPDRILKYDITTSTWSVTSFTDVGQCGNATGRVGRNYYSWGGAYQTAGTYTQSKALRTTIL
jgi:hypothetical protein